MSILFSVLRFTLSAATMAGCLVGACVIDGAHRPITCAALLIFAALCFACALIQTLTQGER